VFEFLPNQKLWALAVGIFLNQYDSRTVEYMNLASYFFYQLFPLFFERFGAIANNVFFKDS